MVVTIQDLLDAIDASYDVVKLNFRKTTAGGLVHQHDLWYRQNDVVHDKRLNIYWDKDPAHDAEWYGANPIPPEPVVTFQDKVNLKIQWVYENVAIVKYLAIDSMDEQRKRCILVGYIKQVDEYIEKHAFLWEDAEGDIQYELF